MTNKEAIEILNKGYPDINEYAVSEQEQYYDDVRDYDEALNHAIKSLEERPKGEWVRKEDVIHSIAKQYSEHNELVPIWLSIGDMKGGAE